MPRRCLLLASILCFLLSSTVLAQWPPAASWGGPQPTPALPPGELPPGDLPPPGELLLPDPALPPQAGGLPLPTPDELVLPVAPPAPPPPKLWEGSFELGFNGTQGNSETTNFRLGASGKRKTDDDELTLSLIYTKSTADGRETANRAFGEGRNEWFYDDSPWTLYVHGTGEYDEFKAFDLRLTADAGLGYNFIKNDGTTLVGRFGPGVSQEIGGPDDSLVPEAVLGIEFEHKLSQRQKLLAEATWYPALDDFGDYRLTSKAGWELLIDAEMNLSLQLNVSDRYDSTPNGAKPNDLDYALLLIWKF
jgi:putative salt-induced outer membrane protein YdiY